MDEMSCTEGLRIGSRAMKISWLFRLGRQIARLRDRKKNFPYELAVCAIFKNEAAYLHEWLLFHEGVGVSHFYLYNDASSDDYLAATAPWRKRGMVTLIEWPTKVQTAAYNDCIRRFRMEARWIAFIDIDEFLFNPAGMSLTETLRQYEGVTAIFVYWMLFGSAGHQTRPPGPVLESYRHCMDLVGTREDRFDHGKTGDLANYVTGWSRDGKSIVNPRLVRKQNVHKPKSVWTGTVVDENRQAVRQRAPDASVSYSILRINHYWSKSIAELTAKVERGSIANRKRPKRSLQRWLAREQMLNTNLDETVLPIWRRIKAAADPGRDER